jgi:hypothetical protein
MEMMSGLRARPRKSRQFGDYIMTLLNMLSLTEPTMPPKRKARSRGMHLVRYGFGDAHQRWGYGDYGLIIMVGDYPIFYSTFMARFHR